LSTLPFRAASLPLSPEASISLSHARLLSPSGRCRVFDESADGYVRGEGSGVILLKKLRDAIHDGNKVLAVILAAAAGHNGRGTGLTTPRVAAQRAVIENAWHRAGIPLNAIGYTEAHAVGTKLGDYFEIKAIAEILSNAKIRREVPLIVGSVKTNVGHLEAAAGICSLIKVVLSINQAEVLPNLQLREINSLIRRENWPIEFPVRPMPWPAYQGKMRVAGVSAFGFGGSNCHLVLGMNELL
jgi:acyl transferase domain-containing protein